MEKQDVVKQIATMLVNFDRVEDNMSTITPDQLWHIAGEMKYRRMAQYLLDQGVVIQWKPNNGV